MKKMNQFSGPHMGPPLRRGGPVCPPVILFLILFFLLTPSAFAKKTDAVAPNPRLLNMSSEDRDLFNALTKQQQENIAAGKVEEGYNEWMVKKALGDPYYGTEHHPIYVDYEQVWLYTKPKVENSAKEEKIIDAETNWPTIHREVHTKTCTVGDFFLLFDRGVIQKIVSDPSQKIYGTCVLTNHEEFIPIVNQQPAQPTTKKGKRK